MEKRFSILITTKDRRADLELTLAKIRPWLAAAQCVIYDDGSSDGTSAMVTDRFPEVELLRNESPKGYIFCRNRMLDRCPTEFAISLDDDAHIESPDPLDEIGDFFDMHPEAGVVGFRIFWGKELPDGTDSDEPAQRMAGFVGCGHVWRLAAWREIPSYPEWFVFYGEEEFAAMQLYLSGWEVWYLPAVFVQHRVDVAARRHHADYLRRLRHSLRAGWFLFFLFYPLRIIPSRLGYSVWMQLKTKVLKGQWRVSWTLAVALCDLVRHLPRILSGRRPMTVSQFRRFTALPATKIYWKPQAPEPSSPPETARRRS